jgi:hypothetical protein
VFLGKKGGSKEGEFSRSFWESFVRESFMGEHCCDRVFSDVFRFVFLDGSF